MMEQQQDQPWGELGAGADIAAVFAQQPQPADHIGSSYLENVPPEQLPLADAVARFGMQQQQAQQQQAQQQWAQPPAPQQQWGQPQPEVAAWQQPQAPAPQVEQQPGGGEELPGLTSMAAAEAEARAAAESDEEEYWALPTAPLLRLEYQQQLADEEGRRPLRPAPDMLAGELGQQGRSVAGLGKHPLAP